MCGRYGRRSDKQYIAEHYPIRRKIADLPPMPPGYNITPGTFQPVVRRSEETGEREMCLMEWGLVPYWSTMHKMISNCARDDKLTINGAWIKPFQYRRCLIPGEFFYEWEVPLQRTRNERLLNRGRLRSRMTDSFRSAASGIGGRIEQPATYWRASRS